MNSMLSDIKELMAKEPILTKEEEEKFQSTNCEIHGCIFTKENTKVRPH